MAGLWVSARILLIITAQAFTTEQTTVVPCCYIKGPESHHTCKKTDKNKQTKQKNNAFLVTGIWIKTQLDASVWGSYRTGVQLQSYILSIQTLFIFIGHFMVTFHHTNCAFLFVLFFLQSRNHIPEQIPMIFLLRGMCKWGNLSLKKKKRGGEREMKTVKANWQQRSASACYKH